MIKQKINDRLTELERLMNSQIHLTNPEIVLECIDSITKFWSAVSDEDKDYVDSAQYALDNKLEWKYV
jgi:hypothetical protein